MDLQASLSEINQTPEQVRARRARRARREREVYGPLRAAIQATVRRAPKRATEDEFDFGAASRRQAADPTLMGRPPIASPEGAALWGEEEGERPLKSNPASDSPFSGPQQWSAQLSSTMQRAEEARVALQNLEATARAGRSPHTAEGLRSPMAQLAAVIDELTHVATSRTGQGPELLRAEQGVARARQELDALSEQSLEFHSPGAKSQGIRALVALSHAIADLRDSLGSMREIAAGVKWNMGADGGEWHPLDRNVHPGQAAIQAVASVLSDLDLPTLYNLRYGGMRRSSGKGNGIETGLIYVEMSMESISGHKAVIDIPVVVRQSRMLAPGTMLYNGEQRVITQSAFDEILKRGTFYIKEPDRRNMYAPPVEGSQQRKVPLMRPGVYGQGLNRQLFARQANVGLPPPGWDVNMVPDPITGEETWKLVDPQGQEHATSGPPLYFGMLSQEEAITYARKLDKQQKHQQNTPSQDQLTQQQVLFDQMTPEQRAQNMGMSMQGRRVFAGRDLAHIDPAERERPAIVVGCDVKPTEELCVYGRNGNRWTIPAGTAGVVLTDTGAGAAYKVWWEELGFHAVVPGDMLKKA